VGRNCQRLLSGAGLLALPVLISEQYPKGLGATLPYLRAAAPTATVLAKTHFSCADDEAMRAQLAAVDRDWIIVAGIEAHVCVLATVDDLLRRGWRVAVVADAVASRDAAHVEHAIATMRQLGALVTPLESILFRLQRQAGIGNFKELSSLLR
jgi:nicotinamidase-related amidase